MGGEGRPQVAIAIVTVGPGEVLAAALESMAADVQAGLAEVWVVDNGSEDGSAEMVERRFPWARLVVPGENLGYGRAVNLVADRSQAPWVAASNDDVELRPGALVRLLAVGDANPRAAALAPRLELPDGTTQHSPHPFPTVGFSLAFNAGLFRLSPAAADRWCLEGRWNPSVAREVPWAMAAFLLIRRDVFEELGGFSAEQFMHAEDLDLGWRIARAGLAPRYEPGAVVLHHGSVSTTAVFGAGLQQRWTAATYSWMARTRGLPRTRAVAAANIAGAAARWGAFAVLARLSPRRWGSARDAAREWTRVHRAGLRPRGELERRF